MEGVREETAAILKAAVQNRVAGQAAASGKLAAAIAKMTQAKALRLATASNGPGAGPGPGPGAGAGAGAGPGAGPGPPPTIARAKEKYVKYVEEKVPCWNSGGGGRGRRGSRVEAGEGGGWTDDALVFAMAGRERDS